MKYSDFKLLVIVDEKTKELVLFAKKKNGLFFAQADRAYYHTEGGGMHIILGLVPGRLTINTINGAKWATITLPEVEEILKFKAETNAEKITRFLDTDYHGFKLPVK